MLRVQDTGGQPVFLSILELLTTAHATVYLVVFDLRALHADFAHGVATIVEQLQSIALFASGAPILLAGTRKDAVDRRHLKSLSDRLRAELDRRCAAAAEGLQMSHLKGAGEVCFFGIENARGFGGDESIRQLVGAIERAARALPSMQQRVPLLWLRVLDELRRWSRERRHVALDEVRALARRVGMPHGGLHLEQELSAMLGFFHSLNALLWYEAPRLRELVVLDARWVVDAACCFIRDFELRDHTEHHRMHALDQRAHREQPEAWALLTRGRARLRRPLLRLLWSEDDFAPHHDALLDLMTRFGLAIPAPAKPGDAADDADLLVPSLLPDATPSASLTRWHADGGRERPSLRIFCTLDGEGRAPAALTYEGDDLGHGFLPIGAFHRLCAAALGCSELSAAASAGGGAALERHAARVAFGKDVVLLRHVAEESSIVVELSADGREHGAASRVADQLRVLLSEELQPYRHLRHRLLVSPPGYDGSWYADLDELSKLDVASTPLVHVRGEHVDASELKQALSHWWTAQCDFYVLDAEWLRSADAQSMPTMLRLQDVLTRFPSRVSKERFTMAGVLGAEYERGEYLAVSHRCASGP